MTCIFNSYLCPVTTQRFFIELAYDGTNYHGCQSQHNAVSVQEVLNKALSTVLREPIGTLGCGRTDTGVHAKEFFAHFDSGKAKSEIEHPKFEISLNSVLPNDIAVKNIIPVHADAHA